MHEPTNQNPSTPTINKVDSLNQSFDDAGVRWKAERYEVLEAFSKDNEVVYDEDGSAHTYLHGSRVPLRLGLKEWAATPEGRELADGRSLRHRESTDSAGNGVTSKADLKTSKEASEFISRFGYERYASLPTKPVVNTPVVYLEDFHALPRAEKVRRINADPDILRKLSRRPSDQPYRGFINHGKLEEQKRVRDGSKVRSGK